MEPEALVEKLNSLHDLDETVLRLIALGPAAIAPLERFLLSGKPGVIYQPRRPPSKRSARLGPKTS